MKKASIIKCKHIYILKKFYLIAHQMLTFKLPKKDNFLKINLYLKKENVSVIYWPKKNEMIDVRICRLNIFR